jgi:hypothetical protein
MSELSTTVNRYTDARFLGSFPLTSGVLRRAGLRLWSVPTVGEHGPFLHAVEFCASSHTTNAKRTLPIPGDGGLGGKGKQTGSFSERSGSVSLMCSMPDILLIPCWPSVKEELA